MATVSSHHPPNNHGGNMRRILLALVALALLVGCSSAAKQAAVAPSSVSSSTDAPAKTSTVAQWGSIVAGSRVDIDRLGAQISGCITACGGNGLNYSAFAEGLAGKLKAASDPKSPSYLGTAPPELTALISQTITATSNVWNDETAITGACTVQTSDACNQASMTWALAVRTLTSTLGAWSPYTH